MIDKLVSWAAARCGYVKIPPHHSCKLMAERDPSDLTEYGRSTLENWQAKRALVVALWDAVDAARELKLS